MPVETQDFAIVVALGALIGIGELISRYRDDPASVVMTPPGIIYLMLNASAAAAALALIRLYGWSFGIEVDDTEKLRWVQVLVAGLGAMALFRSSLFNVRIGNQDIAVGPNTFLQVALTATDSEVDRQRAARRAKLVAKIMDRVLFDKAYTALPKLCVSLMQNLPPERAQQVERDAVELNRRKDLSLRGKGLTLGLILMNNVGVDVLSAAVTSLGDEIATPASPEDARTLPEKIASTLRRGGKHATMPAPRADLGGATTKRGATTPEPPGSVAGEPVAAPAAAAIIGESTGAEIGTRDRRPPVGASLLPAAG